METNARSIVKAVSYRLLGSSVTGLILFVITGKGTLSLVGSVADIAWLEIGAGLAAGIGGVTLGLSMRRANAQGNQRRYSGDSRFIK